MTKLEELRRMSGEGSTEGGIFVIDYKRIKEAAEFISRNLREKPEIGLILGSGLGFMTDEIEDPIVIEYQDIPHFPRSTAPGHEGKLVAGKLFGKSVITMKGRFHTYEGYDPSDVVLPVYVMKEIGVERLLITNAAGGINRSFNPGEIVIIKDVISILAFRNPLRGPNDESLGPRFPDMSEPFDRKWISKLKEKADLKEGVYIWTLGPSYETPAEIRAFGKLGADMVGMSTVPEVIAANHVGLKVLGLSCITNMAAGILDEPLSHEDVLKVANMVKSKFARVVRLALEVI
jgi:purine-nucleoside phosphorylase